MLRPDHEFNQLHCNNPTPGDYWAEHFVLYHVVLQVLPNGNRVVAKKDYSIKDGQRPDLTQAFEITKEDHEKVLKYKGRDRFVADVVVGSKVAHEWLIEWAHDLNGAYKPLSTEKEA